MLRLNKIRILILISALLSSYHIVGLNFQTQFYTEIQNNNFSPFDHIYGASGHYTIVISEEDNLIFTNSPIGLMLMQLDDISNYTLYDGEEIGLLESFVQCLEIDTELKLLYVATIGGVDVINYTQTPLSASNILSGVLMNFNITKSMDVDPTTHFLYITSQTQALTVYDPIHNRFADISGYIFPDAEIYTVDVDHISRTLYLGTSEGLCIINLDTNGTQLYTIANGLVHNDVMLVRSYPTLGLTFCSTVDDGTGISDGLTVVFDNGTIRTFDYAPTGMNPRSVNDIACDLNRGYGYIVSSTPINSETGFLVFNLTDFSGVAKGAYGSFGEYGIPLIYSTPMIEGLDAAIEIIENTGELIIGSVQRIQKIYFTPPSSATVENAPILGLYHNLVSDVVYDPTTDRIFLSELLGLDLANPYEHNITHIVQMAGCDGTTSGELLLNSHLFYHHTIVYNITDGTYANVPLPFDEYGFIMDIGSSANETLLYYCVGTDKGGAGSNGSFIVYNRLTGNYTIHDLGYDKVGLNVIRVLPAPNVDDLLYIATNQGLITFNISTLSVIKKYETNLEFTSLEWVNNKLYVGVSTAPIIRIFDPVEETFTVFDPSLEMTPTVNDIMFLDTTNELFVSTNRGFYGYNFTNNVLKFEGEDEGLSTLFVSRMAYIPTTDKIWIGSFQGVNIYDRTADFTPPSLEVTGLAEGENITTSKEISISAEDYSGINSIVVYIDDTLKATLYDSSSFLINATELSTGHHTITVTTYDNNMLSRTVTIGFNVVELVNEFPKLVPLLILPIFILPAYLYIRKRK